jgi:hypothetical protein
MDLSYLDKLNELIDESLIKGNKGFSEEEAEFKYLSTMAPNIIEWVTGLEYWNSPTTFNVSRQYQILRDFFNLRCKFCNSQDPEAIECWGKSRSYLESEVLLVWNNEYEDFQCPKCRNTLKGYMYDGVVKPYNELMCIAGMRSGKSFLGAHIGGYIEHVLRVMSMSGRGAIQKKLKQEKSEWFEVTFAASTATQASETVFAKYKEMREKSPWVMRHINWLKNKEAKQPKTRKSWSYAEKQPGIYDGWLQVRFNRVASDSSGVAGKTRVFAAIDELARLSNTESKTSAKELYRVLNQSLKTVRVAVDNYGLFPFFGIMLNVTSPIAIDDVAMNLYYLAKNNVLKRTFCWKGATWEFNPSFSRSDFDDEYAKDSVGAERDFGANPPAAETPLIDDTLRFWKSIDYSKSPIASFDSYYLTDKTGKNYIAAKLKEVSYNFDDNHYLFCDAGEQFDAFSMVCAHPVMLSEDNYQELNSNTLPQKIEPPDGFTSITDLPFSNDSPLGMGLNHYDDASYGNAGRVCTVYDFCLRIVPEQDKEIWFNSIIDIIKDLRKKIRIVGVGFDSWQSTSSIQVIRDMGVQADKVRLKMENFSEFVAAAYSDQVALLPPLKEDFFNLSDVGTLELGKDEREMSHQAVGILELLKLERSKDLKKIITQNKGRTRGKSSDDIARCIIGVDFMIKNSFVSAFSSSNRKRNIIKRLMASRADKVGAVFNPKSKG